MTSSCMLVLNEDCPQAIPFMDYTAGRIELDMPTDRHPVLSSVLKEHEKVFRRQLGSTDIVEHVIDTGDAPPVKVPPCPIALHFTTGTVSVNNYRNLMAKEGII